MSYAVRDFYLNGGAQAVIVRLYHADSGDPDATPPVSAVPDKSKFSVGDIKLEAAYKGKWGASLRITIDQDQISQDVDMSMGLTKKICSILP